MADEVEITLPVSGAKVLIRNYTTRSDDQNAEQILAAGVEAKENQDGEGNINRSVVFPVASVMASQQSYISRLVKSIDGDGNNIVLRLGDLRSKDYEAIESAIEKIVEEHSPKAKEAKNASKNNIKGK